MGSLLHSTNSSRDAAGMRPTAAERMAQSGSGALRRSRSPVTEAERSMEDLGGAQSPWMDRPCGAGNGGVRYGLVSGAKPWSWLLHLEARQAGLWKRSPVARTEGCSISKTSLSGAWTALRDASDSFLGQRAFGHGGSSRRTLGSSAATRARSSSFPVQRLRSHAGESGR